MKKRSLRRREGQGLVEFAMIVPVFLLILVGMLEFGFLFDQAMTLNYATREGARSGAAFAAGNSQVPCADVDKNVIAAVQRVLDSPGSRVTTAEVGQIRLYRASSTGTDPNTASTNQTWTYSNNSGPVIDGAPLDFVDTGGTWDACTRDNSWSGTSLPPDSIGVSIRYTYRLVTPLSLIMGFFGSNGPASITISDRTVMALNPTNN